MIGIIAENRKLVFHDIEMLALKSVIGFFVIILAWLAALQVKALSPIREAAESARRISSGNLMARFRNERAGLLSKLSSELNHALDYVNGMLVARDRANDTLASSLRTCVNQIEAIDSVLSFAGRTLSKNELLQMAMKEAVASGGASAAAVYLIEDGVFRLKSSAGLGEGFIRDWSEIGMDFPGAGSGGRAVAFRGLDEFPGQGYAGALRGCGFKTMATVPLTFNDGLTGYICLLFRKEAQDPGAEGAPFFAALASVVSVLLGHFDLYNEERLSKMFLDRVINQVPAAFAVFDLSGRCVVINGALKRLLGADQRLVIAGEYNVFEDELIRAGGFTEQIKKTCEGHSTEFTFGFKPHEMKKYSFFKGPSRRLRIRTFPLYDEGGQVSNILLIYEEIQEQDNAGADAASK
ncbi:MAG: PAS domain-containing protein, partial [Deltaproteobacteria bacterium]|nr:PAS domain-containing protein [Deltaproteobacteria bacterium]